MNNFAISSDGIATALQDSASSLMAAGNTLEQSVAMIAAANKVVQDPNSVGAALRTISLRIRGTSVKELEEMGEETDGVVASVSKLQSKVMGLSGVNILTDSGAYKDTYTIIKEIAEVWDEMNDMDRAALLELLAGKNRSNTMAAMLTNLEDLEDAYESALGAEGSALKENEKYLDSIQGKIDQFTNAVQTMWSNLLDAEIVKFVVDLGTALVKLADSLGLVGTAAVALGAKAVIPKAFSGIKSIFGEAKNAYGLSIGSLWDTSKLDKGGLGSFLGQNGQDDANIAAIIKEITARKALNKEKATEILLSKGVKEENIEGALSAMGYTTANTGLSFSFKALGESIKSAAIAFWASPFGKVAVIVSAILLIGALASTFANTYNNAARQLEKTTDEIADVRSEISSLNEELESTQDRIDELQSKGTLTFTEKTELANLKAQNAELERSIRLEEEKERRLQKKASKELANKVGADAAFGENATVYKNSDGEYVSQTKAVSYGASGFTQSVNDGYTAETVTSIEAQIITLQRTKAALDAAKNDLENASEEEYDAASDKVDRLQREYDSAYDAISGTIDRLDEEYLSKEGVEWQYGYDLEPWQEEMNAALKIAYDAQDQLAIAADDTGKAVKAAFSRVSLQTEFEDDLKFIQEEFGITGEKLEEMYNEGSNAGLNAFIDSLMDAGVIAGTTSEELQKVVELSLEINDNTSDAAVANQKLARSQKRLRYHELSKELKSLSKNYNYLDDETNDRISAIKSEMKALEAEINAYQILGKEIEEIKSKYASLESAKTTDEERSYGDNLADAYATLIEGYQTTKLGTEAVESARGILVPEYIYKDAKTTREKLEKEYEYITETLAKFMTIEFDEDGVLSSVEVKPEDTYTFLEHMKTEGLMTLKDGLWEFTDAASHDLSTLASQAGVTEEVLYALFTQIDEMNANRGFGENYSIFDHLEKDPETLLYNADVEVSKSTQELIDAAVELGKAKEELGKATVGEEGYDAKVERLADAEKAYADAVTRSEEAQKNYSNEVVNSTEIVDEFLDTQALYNAEQAKLNGLLEDYAKAQKNGTDTAEIEKNIKSTTEKIGEYGALLNEYGVSELMITVRRDKFEEDLAEIESKFNHFKSYVIQKDDGSWDIKSGITISESDKAEFEKYLELLNGKQRLDVVLGQDSVDSLTVLQDISDTLSTIAEALTGITNKEWKISIGANITKTVSEFVQGVFGSSSTSTSGGTSSGSSYNARANAAKRGNARAGGSDGLKSSEHNSLVGELGAETVVDPHKGIYYTVGENGAELVDLPKDAIVFNHRQTEDLFKNGHINSRGKAYAQGNAHSGIYLGNVDGYVYAGQSNVTATGGLTKDYQTIGDSLEDEFEELFDWIEILVEEIDEQISLMEAQLENAVGIDAKKNIYSGLIDAEYDKIDAYTNSIGKYQAQANKFLSEIPAQYREMAKNGAIAITEFKGEVNEEVVEAINNYREWAQKAAELNQQLEESKSHISELRVETQSMISTEYENKIGLITHLNDTLEAEMDLLEESGERSSANFYNEMIKNNESQLKLLEAERNAVQKELDDAVKSGDVKKYSDDWYEMVNAVYEVDNAIIETQTSIESFKNSIQELHWENFDKIIDAIVNISDEAENLRDLIDDADITEELNPEQWSKDGLTALGLVAQQMENAKYRSELYAKEIENLNKEYAAGNYTQDEYNEKLKELKDGQWDAIDAYESAKDALIDLNKTRVEAIKDGIQKEIDAYEELINKRKEDLDSQKEAHDWAETVADHQKTIDDIQRQIDAMEGDQSAAAAAARKKLQEELKEAQENYDEALYDHSIETQQKALDNSLETYKEEQEGRMDALDEWLENEEQVIAESYAIISANTEAIHKNIESISDTYGVKIEENVVKPWEAGINALGTYGEKLDTSTSQYVLMLGRVKSELELLQKQADNTANAIIKAANTKATNTQAATKSSSSTSRPYTSTTNSTSSSSGSSSSSSFSKGQEVRVKTTATHFSRNGGNGTKMQSWVPGSKFTVMQTSGNEVLIGINGVATGWVKKTDLQNAYAKGTTGVKSNQLAWIDENGLEEIVMHANNGRLTYLTKGSSVIPHDISENLMELGKVDPKTWLANNRRTTTPVSLTTNNNVIDLSFGSLINIEHADRDSIPEIQDAVKKQLDSYMKNINAGLKKFTR